ILAAVALSKREIRTARNAPVAAIIGAPRVLTANAKTRHRLSPQKDSGRSIHTKRLREQCGVPRWNLSRAGILSWRPIGCGTILLGLLTMFVHSSAALWEPRSQVRQLATDSDEKVASLRHRKFQAKILTARGYFNSVSMSLQQFYQRRFGTGYNSLFPAKK